MKFDDATDVQGTLNAGRDVERIRSANRVIINNLLNGERLIDEATAKTMGLHVNFNSGEAVVIAQQARRQLMNAFERSQRYFKVSIPDAPGDKQFAWEQFISNKINRVMKKSREWLNVGDNWRASVVAHGVGPRVWCDREDWLPEYVAVDDLRVPTNTLTSFSNLDWFARRVWYTEGELVDKVWPESQRASSSWNRDSVAKILDQIHDYNYDVTNDWRWTNMPEKLAQMVRQNGGYYSSDAVPSIPMWHFFYKDADKEGKERWLLRIVVDQEAGSFGNTNEFIYDSGNKSHASNLSELLSCQIGDTNNTAPLLYHSMRSIGFQLVEPCFWSNLTQCRMIQHLMDGFNVWFKVNDPQGRARAQKVEMFDRCVIPDGVEVVPAAMRHQVNPQLIDTVLAKTKQLQTEASSSYTSQVDTGTAREQTAYETAVKVSQVNAMMSGIILTAMRNETYLYMEICRRFCLRGTKNEDAKRFQADCKDFGIESKFINAEMWDVMPEQPLGAGNPTMEMSQAQQLMNIRGAYSPQSQQEILHMVTAAITGNSAAAQHLAPVDVAQQTSNGQKWASAIFGTLMQGVPVPSNSEVSALEQIDPIMGMLATAIHQCEQNGNVANRQQLTGFTTVLGYAQMLVQEIGSDPAQGPVAKGYSQSLGQLANILKGFAQRLQEEEAAGQQDPESQAKIILMQQQSAVKQQATQAKTQQSLTHKEATFQQSQQHKAEQHAMDQQIQARQAALEAQIAKLEASVEVAKAKVQIATDQAKAQAEIQARSREATVEPQKAASAS